MCGLDFGGHFHYLVSMKRGVLKTTVRELIPTQEFEQTLIRIGEEFYGMNGSLLVFGGTMPYPEQNVL